MKKSKPTSLEFATVILMLFATNTFIYNGVRFPISILFKIMKVHHSVYYRYDLKININDAYDP